MRVRVPTAWMWYGLGIGAVLLIPRVFEDEYLLHLFVLSGIYAVLALSYDLVLGRTGYFSLGHIGFFGIGGYAAALAHVHFEAPFLVAMGAAAVVSGAFGLAIGMVSLRLRGPYFVVVTLGFTQIIRLVIVNWVDFTQGPMGITGIPKPGLSLFGFQLIDGASRTGAWYLIGGLVLFTVFLVRRLATSFVGQAWTGIRENVELAQSVGISFYQYSLLAFVISTVLAGLAGAFYVHYVTFVAPEIVSFGEMVIVITMVVVGGEGTIAGAIIGALLFTFVPEYLRIAAAYRMVVFGGVLLLIVCAMPQGIVPFGRRLLHAVSPMFRRLKQYA